ncbi:hypothetical protein MesoLj131b_00930 [Mesorhizobium sp. 131-2-5]|nr:hypothetical protein MesoLj131b_00930 [Mesorhizobium sp. 131-2-5]
MPRITDRNVNFARAKVKYRIRSHKLERRSRRFRSPAFQARQQPARGEGAGCRHPQMADRVARGKAGKLVRDRQKGVPNNRQKLCARSGELQRPRLALKKGLAAIAFQ